MRVLALAIVVSVVAAGCGDDTGSEPPASPQASGAELAAAFGEQATKAYVDNGLDRDKDYAQGTTVDACFFLDDEGAAAIADVLGSDSDEVEVEKDNYINGAPDQSETLVCALIDPSAKDVPTELIATVGAGTTLAEPEQYVEQALRLGKGEEIEGEAEGLDPGEVVAFERTNVLTWAWIHDDFMIGLSAPDRLLSAEDGFAALPTVVDQVSRTLLAAPG